MSRENDLPPRWDGRLIVEWTPWEPQLVTSMRFHRQSRDCCPGCGSPEPPVTARGMVAHDRNLTREQWEAFKENAQRLGALAHKRKQVATWRLRVFRCQDCRHDQVWDVETDTTWDLDHTDYGPDGSSD
jgi:hypothetical protein